MGDKPYNGVVDCTMRVLKTEGVYPFWRGNLANVIRYFPTQALNFAFKDQIKAVFKVSPDASDARKFATNIASGGFAGSLSLSVVYSLDFARTRLANDSKSKDGTRQFNGLIDVYKKTLASDGIGGLYRGFVISAGGVWPGLVPHRYRAQAYDDDLWHRCALQVLHGLRPPDPQVRGLFFPLQGRRSQHSPRYRRSRSPVRIRPRQERLRQNANRIKKSSALLIF